MAPLPDIYRVHIDIRSRPGGFVMESYHCHPYYELFYVDQGACRFFLENQFYDLHAGDFILLPPHLLHYTRYLFGPCRRTDVFFRAADVEGLAGPMGLEGVFDRFQIFQAPSDLRDRIASLFSRMLAEERIQDSRSAPLLQMGLRELLLLCSRSWVVLRDPPGDIHTADRQLLLAARYMSRHFREDISAADIAAAAGFTPNYLSRKFREAAGIGVHQYLVFLRLQQARLELLSTGDSITDIALRCGFSSSNYFKDAFRRQYGMTPRAYRAGT